MASCVDRNAICHCPFPSLQGLSGIASGTEKLESFNRVGYWNDFYRSEGDEIDFYEWYSAEEWLCEAVLGEAEALSALRVGDSEDGTLALLDVGCGTSPLLFEVAANESVGGRTMGRLVGVDFAADAIKFMRQKAKEDRVDAEFLVLDASKGLEEFSDASFDLVVDKGCLDCFVTGSGEAQLNDYLKGVERVLRPRGSFVLIAVNFCDIEHLLATGVIVPDRNAIAGSASTATALARRKANASEKGDGIKTDLPRLRVHRVEVHQAKHLYICRRDEPAQVTASCGTCSRNLNAAYPQLDEQCECGNALRRFALS